VRRSRWEGLSAEQREKFAPLCPDFVIELRSPSEDLAELQAKMAEYLDNGASLGWLIDPFERCVHVYRPGATAERLDSPSTISGAPLLPSFTLDFSSVW
jgi:Uma2 family endonuclease